MRVITAWEGMPVDLPLGVDASKVASRLISATQSYGIPVFRLKRNILHAAEVVGTIQVDGIRINILPKLDSLDEERDRSFLMNILAVSGYIKAPFSGKASVHDVSLDPLELVIFELAGDLWDGINKGVPRRYEERCELAGALRGRIDFSRMAMSVNRGAVEVPVRHQPLHESNELSLCLKATASYLRKLTIRSRTCSLLDAVLNRLSVIPNRRLTIERLNALRLHDSERHWSRVLAVAKLLLAGRSPDPTRAGGTAAYSVLFPLQSIFERVTGEVLSSCFGLSLYDFSRNVGENYLLREVNTGSNVVRLRPDFILRRSGVISAVADAKWKRLTERGRAHGVERDDLYQVTAYLSRYKVSNALVFVPKAPWMMGAWYSSYESPCGNERITLVALDIESHLSRSSIVKAGALSSLRRTVEMALNITDAANVKHALLGRMPPDLAMERWLQTI